ncbi:MAG: hypothetical protein LBJ62_09480 [Bifidobacteriaceae bacterium]|nr:hypothetical protein [Bifidobacteriaceae bacterium]
MAPERGGLTAQDGAETWGTASGMAPERDGLTTQDGAGSRGTGSGKELRRDGKPEPARPARSERGCDQTV